MIQLWLQLVCEESSDSSTWISSNSYSYSDSVRREMNSTSNDNSYSYSESVRREKNSTWNDNSYSCSKSV